MSHEYLNPERIEALERLKKVLSENLPEGFKLTEEERSIGYDVPHSIYPAGYHCDPKQALPFLGVIVQKNFIALYHMGIYADPQLLDWFVAEYPKYCKTKLDMGKSCVRFKKPADIPYELIAELATKMSVQDWIACYESQLKRSRK